MFQGLIHICLEEFWLPEYLNLVHFCEVFKPCSCKFFSFFYRCGCSHVVLIVFEGHELRVFQRVLDVLARAFSVLWKGICFLPIKKEVFTSNLMKSLEFLTANPHSLNTTIAQYLTNLSTRTPVLMSFSKQKKLAWMHSSAQSFLREPNCFDKLFTRNTKRSVCS